ncbi:MAG: hypothetical protein D6737_12170 [Chloroflexi bacterium]|nr:MAG: hypothetical protein CUN54_01700 [Phototrophicales bacterium]RMF79179.1 MAG: hypothetical protein D6737_12170 [Chloroflexota bacterium]
MRLPIWLIVLTATIGVAVVIFLGQTLIINPDRPLIEHAGFAHGIITPNADGDTDITQFSYTLSRDALVSIMLESRGGQEFVFRQNEPRPADDYQVLFSGVVNGFVLPGEHIEGVVDRRLMPDGEYTWRLIAEDSDTGEIAEASGTLILEDGDATLPELVDFTVSPEVFTPNQDGIRDRAEISVFLTKDADLSVFLDGPNGERIFISERQEGRKPGEAGRHQFDYEGGVDLNADPPPDGEYTVVAEAQDAVGQRIRREATLIIQDGGKPLAEIVPQPIGASVIFDVLSGDEFAASEFAPQELFVSPPDDPSALNLTAVTMPLGDLLVFKLTVENYSNVPIRTTGPPPGTIYQQEQRASTLGWLDESGAWRVGIDCDTATSDYPWRWAVGTDEDLITVVDEETGREFHYLPAGERAVVWGAIRMTELIEARNPQNCWAGLIHEDVEVSLQNSRVGAREIELVDLSIGE